MKDAAVDTASDAKDKVVDTAKDAIAEDTEEAPTKKKKGEGEEEEEPDCE